MFWKLKTRIANRRALKIRKAFIRLLASEPRKAIEHVNTKLAEANREEAERQLALSLVA